LIDVDVYCNDLLFMLRSCLHKSGVGLSLCKGLTAASVQGGKDVTLVVVSDMWSNV